MSLNQKILFSILKQCRENGDPFFNGLLRIPIFGDDSDDILLCLANDILGYRSFLSI